MKQVTAPADSKSAAQRALRRKIDTLVTPLGSGVQPGWTVNRLAEYWLEKKTRHGHARNRTPLKSQTLWNYSDQIRRIISPALGSIRVAELDVPLLEAALDRLEDTGLSTMQGRAVLNMMCKLAVRDGALPANPMALVAAPAREPHEVELLAVDQTRRLLQVTHPDHQRIPGRRGPNRDLHDFVVLALATGARISEILAVEHEHVGLTADTPTITISGTLVEPRKGFVEKLHRQESTKTSMTRTLVLPDAALAVVRRRPDHSSWTQVKANGSDDPNPLMASGRGTWLWPSNIRTRLRAAVANTPELIGTTPHTLRRTVANHIAHTVGFDAARMQLGHSLTGSTPLSHYVAHQQQGPDLRHVLDTFFEEI